MSKKNQLLTLLTEDSAPLDEVSGGITFVNTSKATLTCTQVMCFVTLQRLKVLNALSSLYGCSLIRNISVKNIGDCLLRKDFSHSSEGVHTLEQRNKAVAFSFAYNPF